MSSVQQRLSPPLLVGALMFLDPRRWIAAILAIFGILVSIVAPFLPKSIIELIFSKPAAAEIRPRMRRPQSLVAPSSRPPRRPRPRTAGDSPLLPHSTFSSERYRHFFPSSLTAASPLSNSLGLDSGSSHVDSKLSSLPSSPSSLTSSLPPASPMPYIHPLSLPSLDSLDLATDAETLTDKPSASSNPKRPFRVQMPKLGFGRRRSAVDLHSLKSEEASNITVLPTLTSNNTAIAQNSQSLDPEWHGTQAFAVRRNSARSSMTLPPPPISDKTGLSTPRRRFSLFSRDPSSTLLDKNNDFPVPVTPPPYTTIPPVPVLPSPPILNSTATSLPSNVAAGPSRSRAVSSPISHPHSEDMIPLEQTSTPPFRPARTDPYKTYGVPVPGSDQARAFLRAERERIRAERERRERERVIREQGTPQEAKGRAGATSERRNSQKHAGVEKVERREQKFSPRCSKKGKGPAHGHEFDPGGEADAEDEKHTTDDGVDEFGVLPPLNATSASPQAQTLVRPTSSHGKRNWIFTRRSPDATGDKLDKRREKVIAKEKPVKLKRLSKDPRPKSRDSSHGSRTGFGFRSKDTPRNKDRGYSSDTGVPSLTYKLMYEPSSFEGAARG